MLSHSGSYLSFLPEKEHVYAHTPTIHRGPVCSADLARQIFLAHPGWCIINSRERKQAIGRTIIVHGCGPGPVM